MKTKTNQSKLSSVVLALWEVESLFNEIRGVEGNKGLLSQEISLVHKKRLMSLLECITPHMKHIKELRNDLIEKYGNKDGENWIIPTYTKVGDKDVPNPKLQKYEKEITELLEAKETIQVNLFKIEDFDFKTSDVYPVFLNRLCE